MFKNILYGLGGRMMLIIVGALIIVLGIISPNRVINATATAFRENGWVDGVKE